MSQSIGPYTDRFGLVFGYDTSDTANSFKGEPTTNLSYNNGQGGSEYLSSVISWVNAGSWVHNDNETDVPKPSIPGVNTTNLRIQSGRNTTAGGSVHFGCGFTYISPSRTYTVSVWYRQNRAGASQPYLRTNITNVGLANLAYNGNTDSSTWPVNQWIRISATGTVASNEDGVYISNYIGTYVGDKVWYFGHQVEEKDHVTPLVAGTRSTTQGLIDIVNNNTINLANVSYDSNGMIQFDGTDDYINVSSSSNYAFGTGPFTIEVMIYPQSFSNYTHMVALPDQSVFALKANVSDGAIYYYNPSFTTYGSTPGWTLSLNTWNHVVMVRDGTTVYCYLNGVLKGSVAGFTGDFSTQQMRIGWGWSSEFTSKKINAVKIYNKQLSASDVLMNYNNYKKRFGI